MTLKALPALPAVIAQMMTVDLQSDEAFERVLSLLEKEPGFSVRVLAIANSMWSAPLGQVGTLRSAISRVGVVRAASAVIAAGVTSVFVPREAWQKGLWRHAIEVATGARLLAAVIDDPEVNGDEAYVCGLLHDVGHFVLFERSPESLAKIEEEHWGNPIQLLAAEEAVCGTTHAEVGATAATHWGLPQGICEVIRQHHSRRLDPHGRVEKLAALVEFVDFAMFPGTVPGFVPPPERSPEDFAALVKARLPHFIRRDVMSGLQATLKKASAEARAASVAIGVG